MRQIKSARGFTILETLVAMMILTTTSTAMLGMLRLSMATARSNALDSHAAMLAVQEREDLRSIVYSAIASRDPYTTSVPNMFKGVAFTVHSNVQVDTPVANTKTITVTTSWSDRGQARSYAVQTVYTNVNG